MTDSGSSILDIASRKQNSDLPLSTARICYVIGLLWVVNICNYIDRMALAVLLPSIKKDMVLTDSQLGLLTGLAFSVFYAICGIPIARLADRGVRKTVIAVALAVWSMMTALSGSAQNFAQLFLARVGVGAGEAGSIPPAQSLICDYVRPERRGGVLAFHSTGIFVGMMLSMTLAGGLESSLGWRWTFVALGAPGLLIALVIWGTLDEPRRGRLDQPAGHQVADVHIREALTILARIPAYRCVVLFYIFNGFAQYGFNQWWPSLFTRRFDLSASALGFPLGVAIGLGAGIGLIGGGVVANRLIARNHRLPLKIGAAITCFAIPASLWSIFAPSIMSSVFAAGVTVLCWSSSNGALFAATFNMTPPQIRTTAGAIPIFFAAIFGFGLGPLAVGIVSDALTGIAGSSALQYAMIIPALGFPIMAFTLFKAAATLPDRPRAGT